MDNIFVLKIYIKSNITFCFSNLSLCLSPLSLSSIFFLLLSVSYLAFLLFLPFLPPVYPPLAFFLFLLCHFLSLLVFPSLSLPLILCRSGGLS